MLTAAAALVFWVAVALTPGGPQAGVFDSKEECVEAAQGVRVRTGWPVSDCVPVQFKQST